MSDTFYRDFSERQRQLTEFGRARRSRTERNRLGLVMRHLAPPGDLLEVGPGHGTLALAAVEAGWRYRGVEASTTLVAHLRDLGLDIVQAWAPPLPAPDASCDVVYADQVLEHMTGLDAARAFVAEALRALRPGGVCFVVVPDYLTQRTFFWDVDYTHNFVTTERRVRQLLYDGGFDVREVVRSIGAATGFRRDALAAAAVLTRLPGLDTLSRYTGTEHLLFRARKNVFETLEFVARKPTA
jgi:SAM-dependent methyltransferase